MKYLAGSGLRLGRARRRHGGAARESWGSVILVRWETAAADIHGLMQAKGIVTAHGGMTSHAAVVARGMGKPCGSESLTIDLARRVATIGGREVAEGEEITIDGATGRVMIGRVELSPPRLNEDFETILEWADDVRRLRVHANADTPADAAKARELGAEGIGLCRTEHMFMAQDRLPVVARYHGPRRNRRTCRPGQGCCRCSRGVRRASSRRWTGCPSRSGCSTRRCTSSCLRSNRATDDRMRERIKSASRDQPDARDPGLPPRPALAGDLRDAGTGDRASSEEQSRRRQVRSREVEIMHPLVGFRRGAEAATPS